MSNAFQKKQIVKAFVDIYFDLLSTIKEQLENKNAEFNKFYAKNFVLKKTNIKILLLLVLEGLMKAPSFSKNSY